MSMIVGWIGLQREKKLTKCEMRGLYVGRPNVIQENERIFFLVRSFVRSFVEEVKNVGISAEKEGFACRPHRHRHPKKLTYFTENKNF